MTIVPAQSRFYRRGLRPPGLTGFRVTVQETDLQIHADLDLTAAAIELVLEYRGLIEAFIDRRPVFRESLTPVRIAEPAPMIVQAMARAAAAAGVGPMAAVAGAIAEHVGRDLLSRTQQVIVENGGDVFVSTRQPVVMGIYAGSSPLSRHIGLRVGGGGIPVGVCTSSGTIGHSLSLGSADAVCVVSSSCALADAAATAIGNRIDSAHDIAEAIAFGRGIGGVAAVVVIVGERIGCWGAVELVPLKAKKG
ncbi:MAG: UPF0280 family protein [Desulfobacterales bacterium]|jgi:uncharacterized protein